jgi:hypothetical protein
MGAQASRPIGPPRLKIIAVLDAYAACDWMVTGRQTPESPVEILFAPGRKVLAKMAFFFAEAEGLCDLAMERSGGDAGL